MTSPVSLRQDAQRNRERILEAARETFREQGLDAPLEEIARRAGVGIATLYRRFPTRDALIEDGVRRDASRRSADAAEEALRIDDAWTGCSARSSSRCASGRRRLGPQGHALPSLPRVEADGGRAQAGPRDGAAAARARAGGGRRSRRRHAGGHRVRVLVEQPHHRGDARGRAERLAPQRRADARRVPRAERDALAGAAAHARPAPPLDGELRAG